MSMIGPCTAICRFKINACRSSSSPKCTCTSVALVVHTQGSLEALYGGSTFRPGLGSLVLVQLFRRHLCLEGSPTSTPHPRLPDRIRPHPPLHSVHQISILPRADVLGHFLARRSSARGREGLLSGGVRVLFESFEFGFEETFALGFTFVQMQNT
ncbi:hypothetical protein BDZ97DRAFT_63780 [Flammula alnicola]|nr:hypothetical protein BDZ97DRAFT_63780 [Flammula alnicola]